MGLLADRFGVIQKTLGHGQAILKEASQLWKSKLQSIQLHRAVVWVAGFFLVSIALDWLLFVSALWARWSGVPGDSFVWGLANHAADLGVVATILMALIIFSWGVFALQAHLPFWLSWPITLGLFLSARFFVDVKLWFVEQVRFVYPAPLREWFLDAARSWHGPLVWVVQVGLLMFTVTGLYVTVRAALGLHRGGARFRNGSFYRHWRKPASWVLPYPWELPRVITSWRASNKDARGARRAQSPAERLLRKKKRKISRSARRRNRR